MPFGSLKAASGSLQLQLAIKFATESNYMFKCEIQLQGNLGIQLQVMRGYLGESEVVFQGLDPG